MTPLKEKMQTSLEEARILVLGVQVLLGFELRSLFEKSFDEMPDWARALKLAALSAMIAVVLMEPFGEIDRAAQLVHVAAPARGGARALRRRRRCRPPRTADVRRAPARALRPRPPP